MVELKTEVKLWGFGNQMETEVELGLGFNLIRLYKLFTSAAALSSPKFGSTSTFSIKMFKKIKFPKVT